MSRCTALTKVLIKNSGLENSSLQEQPSHVPNLPHGHQDQGSGLHRSQDVQPALSVVGVCLKKSTVGKGGDHSLGVRGQHHHGANYSLDLIDSVELFLHFVLVEELVLHVLDHFSTPIAL